MASYLSHPFSSSSLFRSSPLFSSFLFFSLLFGPLLLFTNAGAAISELFLHSLLHRSPWRCFLYYKKNVFSMSCQASATSHRTSQPWTTYQPYVARLSPPTARQFPSAALYNTPRPRHASLPPPSLRLALLKKP